MASAQIGTINYAVPENCRSPRNILAADLGAGQAATRLYQNQKMISLGLNQMESTEDLEAQRNRQINVTELQSLLL